MCCGTEVGSYLRLIDSCITQLKAQGPSRTCDESKEVRVQGADFLRAARSKSLAMAAVSSLYIVVCSRGFGFWV